MACMAPSFSRRSRGRARLLVLFLSCLAAACSDSGGGSSAYTPPRPTTPTTPTAPTGPTWTSGVYDPASDYINRCETVRTGVDTEGNAYPDMSGSTLEENFWLRSWTHETYLWPDEVVDRDPANYTDPLDYFDVLKTFGTTASGGYKDNFHFSEPTDQYLDEINSAGTASYGADFVALSAYPPRDFRVAYNEPNTPASEVVSGLENLPRGAKILEIDGVDLVNATGDAAIDTLNNGLFPATAGEAHSFVIQDAGSSTSRTVNLISADVAFSAVNRYSVIDTTGGKVGYMLLNTFSTYASEKEIADAISALKADGVTDLVLDLRYNGGGLLAVASELAYMIAGDAQTSGRTFEAFEFNNGVTGANPVTGELNQPFPFFDTALGFSLSEGTPLDTLDLRRVFVLSTGSTCSASEAVINGLRGVDVDIILMGDTTCGKPYGFYPADNCGETYFSIQFKGVNDKGFGDYADGFAAADSNDSYAEFVPGCSAEDDFNDDLGDETEGLLATALYYRENGVCPPAPLGQASKGITVQSLGAEDLGPVERLGPDRGVMHNNRDMTLPSH